MLDSESLKHILFFPFKDTGARKNFLVAVALGLAGFVIPVIPWVALIGYSARIMRSIIEEGRPAEMPAWDDMGDILVDGARLALFRLVATLPYILLIFLFVGAMVVPSILMEIDPHNADTYGTLMGIIALVFSPVLVGVSLLSFPIAVVLAAAEAHVVTQRSISAGFRVTEWWPIFRKNIAGFIVIYLVFFVVGSIIAVPMAIAIMTIVLICLTPLLFMVYIPYSTIVMYTLVGHAYAQGRSALNAAPSKE